MGFFNNAFKSILGSPKDRVFRILSVDGGGLRGLFPATILENMKNDLGIEFKEEFDLVIGTSTGSIIAAGLATNFPVKNLKTLYLDRSEEIFNDNGISLKGIRKSKYSKESFVKEVADALGDRKMNETEIDLLITAGDVTKGKAVVLSEKDDVKIADAVIASCSAPVYFKPHSIDDKFYVDGGIWANSPALIALVEAMSEYKKPLKQIQLLSIGTGEDKSVYFSQKMLKKSKNWGILKWNSRLVTIGLQVAKDGTDRNCQKLLSKKNYLRLDFTSKKNLPMDDPGLLHVLERMGNQVYRRNKKKLARFFAL
jgi:hypothetical protein